jgi:hypothetical protein
MLSLGVFGIRNASSGASTPTCEDTINKFQCLFNAWVEQVKENNPNILDAKHPTAIQDEIATWQVVRHEWRGFEKQINKMYGI